MRLAGITVAAFAAAAMTPPVSASGEERQIVYYSVWGDCIGNPATPLCALDTLFSCMVRGDRDMCATVGATDDCSVRRITGVRYVVDRVTETGVSFRASVCRDDRPCAAPATIYVEQLERAGGSWRFRSTPHIHAQMCLP